MIDRQCQAVVDDLKAVLEEKSASADPSVLRKLVEDSSTELQASVVEEAAQKEVQMASSKVLACLSLPLAC